MLEKPDLPDQLILACLQHEFGLRGASLTFLPLGADANTAVYRAELPGGRAYGRAYFVKLRKGDFAEIALSIPEFLSARGMRCIIAPLRSRPGRLWAELASYRVILYPYIPGKDGYEQSLTDQQWVGFGEAMQAIHAVRLPEEIERRVPREQFSPRQRESVRKFQALVENRSFRDPVAGKLAAFMHEKREEIQRVVERADQLAQELRQRDLPFVLCHSDIHPGNLLLPGDGSWYLVDWDDPILAPRERDLLLVGGTPTWNGARQEALFYSGYGQPRPDRVALAYYRYERVIADIAAFAAQLLLSSTGREDREQSFQYFTSNFLPGHEIELATRTDQATRAV